MLIVPIELYKKMSGWLVRKNVFSFEKDERIEKIIKAEMKYIKNKDNIELKEKNDGLVKKVGGFHIRI